MGQTTSCLFHKSPYIRRLEIYSTQRACRVYQPNFKLSNRVTCATGRIGKGGM